MIATRLLTPLIAVAALNSAATVFGQQRDSVEVLRTIDYPKSYSTSTIASAISNDGRIVGIFFDGFLRPWGFRVGTSGHFSPPLVYPGSSQTVVTGVNTAVVACGYYSNSHGFFYDQHTFTRYDYPGAAFTTIQGENDAGDFVGTYQMALGQPLVGFINVGGNVTSFRVDGAFFTIPTGVNNGGEVVGYYTNSHEFNTHGFYRSVDGTLTFPLDYPNARSTTLYGINDSGTVIGTWEDLSGLSGFNHGLILQFPDLFTSFDVPGATNTYGRGVNNEGEIVGSYIDSSGDGHGFVGRLFP
jgi:hypothetical protein